MRQIKLFPGGAQADARNVMSSSSTHFAYASEASIFVYRIRTGCLTDVLVGQMRRISCIEFSPCDSNVLASCGHPQTLLVFDLRRETRKEYVLPMKDRMSCLSWSMFDPSTLAIAGPEGVAVLNTERSTNRMVLSNDSKTPTVIRWNPFDPDILVVGFYGGMVDIVDSSNGVVLSSFSGSFDNVVRNPAINVPSDRYLTVEDIRWDPSARTVLYVSLSSGKLVVVDYNSGSRLHMFHLKMGPCRSLEVFSHNPGCFLGLSQESTAVCFYDVNSSDPSVPVETLEVGKAMEGFRCVKGSENELVVCFRDGSAGLYRVEEQSLESFPGPGHRDTVFDCRFSNYDANVLASCSFDGTVKVWDVLSGSSRTLVNIQGCVLYCIAWHPTKMELVCSTSSGTLLHVDTESGSLIRTVHAHAGRAFRVAWCPRDARLVASCGGDNFCRVFSDGKAFCELLMPSSAFGVDWSPRRDGLLATGCQDGFVRVYQVKEGGRSDDSLVWEFRGHRKRIFNVVWSPFEDEVLASGADDGTIRVWEGFGKLGRSKMLIGHENRVRALVWHPEISCLLLSGGWDRSIRLWDIRSESCIFTLKDHHSDVYGLHLSMLRPFVVASCSRDATLRLWQIEGASAVICTRYLSRAFGSDLDGTNSGVDVRSCESSFTASARLVSCVHDGGRARVEKLEFAIPGFEEVHSFFDHFVFMTNGEELFRLIAANLGQFSGEVADIPYFQTAIENVRREGGSFLENQRLSKGAAAAVLRNLLFSGDLYGCCEIYAQLGEWDRALALAPCISKEYWEELVNRRIPYLFTCESDPIPFACAVGERRASLSWLLKRKRFSDAFLLANQLSTKSFASRSDVSSAERFVPSAGERWDTPGAAALKVATSAAEFFFTRGDVSRSVCWLLSVNDELGAISQLLRGGELDLAVLCCGLFQTPVEDVYRLMLIRCESIGLWEYGLQFARLLATSADDFCQFEPPLYALSNIQREPREKRKLQSFGFNSPEEYGEMVRKFEKKGRKDCVAACLVLAGQGSTALDKILSFYHEDRNEMQWKNFSTVLGCVPPKLLSSHPGRRELVGFAMVEGVFQAINRKFVSLVRYMLLEIERLVFGRGSELELRSLAQVDRVLAAAMTHAAVAGMEMYVEHRSTGIASQIFRRLVESNRMAAPADVAAGKKLLTEATQRMVAEKPVVDCSFVFGGARLPSSPVRAELSMLSDQRINGRPVILDQLAGNAISSEEAWMWALCVPFSPLCTGELIDPFSMLR